MDRREGWTYRPQIHTPRHEHRAEVTQTHGSWKAQSTQESQDFSTQTQNIWETRLGGQQGQAQMDRDLSNQHRMNQIYSPCSNPDPGPAHQTFLLNH